MEDVEVSGTSSSVEEEMVVRGVEETEEAGEEEEARVGEDRRGVGEVTRGSWSPRRSTVPPTSCCRQNNSISSAPIQLPLSCWQNNSIRPIPS